MPGKFRRIRQWYRYIPTSLTLGNSLCGFAAILYTLNVYKPENEDVGQLLAVSAWLIVFAMVFDMLDGWTARILKAHSEHGAEMDSLADMVTFGVAPAVMVAVMAHAQEINWLPYRLVWVLSAMYLACVALRLALYNVLARMPGKHDEFRGLPSPGAAAAVASLVILYSRSEPQFLILATLLPLYAAVLGVLMVSSIPYAHVGQWLGSKRSNKIKILSVIIFFVLFSMKPPLVAAVAINLYVLSGPLKALYEWLDHRIFHPNAVDPEEEEELISK